VWRGGASDVPRLGNLAIGLRSYQAVWWQPSFELYPAFSDVGEDEISGQVDKGAYFSGTHMAWMFYLARICNHCTYPACLASCPRGSIYKRPEDGVVLIDQSRCRGYQECIRACPYKKTFFNPTTGTSEKCIGCYPKIEQGEQPQCFTNCIGKIRLQGFVSVKEAAREDNPIDYLVHMKRLALPLYPQLGLEPNVYYVPPLHVPDSFLIQMFGPQAVEAKKTYLTAREDRKLAGLFTLFGCTPYTIHSFKVKDDMAFGYDAKGAELVRVPVQEPIFERPQQDSRLQVARMNTT